MRKVILISLLALMILWIAYWGTEAWHWYRIGSLFRHAAENRAQAGFPPRGDTGDLSKAADGRAFFALFLTLAPVAVVAVVEVIRRKRAKAR